MNRSGAGGYVAEHLTRRLSIRRLLHNGGSILACALCLLVLPVSTRADEQVETLEKLRERYQEAHDFLADTENPAFGSDGFREKLQHWAQVNKEWKDSASALISELLNHWMALPQGAPENKAVEQEIKLVFKDLAVHPNSEQYNIAKSFIIRATWPFLADTKLTKEQAAFLAELVEPQALVRKADQMAQNDQRYESIGWDTQSAYALALIRGGNEKEARAEITILHKKVSMQHQFNPKGRLDYGPEAGEGRHRNYVDYLQLCELLHGLQAAISNDREDAKKHIENARKLREALSPEATPLMAELERRLKTEND